MINRSRGSQLDKFWFIWPPGLDFSWESVVSGGEITVVSDQDDRCVIWLLSSGNQTHILLRSRLNQLMWSWTSALIPEHKTWGLPDVKTRLLGKTILTFISFPPTSKINKTNQFKNTEGKINSNKCWQMLPSHKYSRRLMWISDISKHCKAGRDYNKNRLAKSLFCTFYFIQNVEILHLLLFSSV